MNSRENEANACRKRESESRPGCFPAWGAALFALGPSPGSDNCAARFLTSSPEDAVMQSTWMQQTTLGLVLYFRAYILAEIMCLFFFFF